MLTENQISAAALTIGCDVAAVKAVREIESSGDGFLKDGRLKILFEGHQFWHQLVHAGKNPNDILHAFPGHDDILFEHWTRKFYKYGAAEWDRWSKAVNLCKLAGAPVDCALNSASYGAFQIMGFNAKACGIFDAHSLIVYMNKGEYEQLLCFLKYVKNEKLDKYLIAKDWSAFAYRYNGSGYKGNPLTTNDDYDLKLKAAYEQHSQTKAA